MEFWLVNESSLLSEQQAWMIAWALDHQARFQIGRSGWRGDIRVGYLPGGGKTVPRLPAGTCVIHMLDTSDEPGALGYHDEDGNEVPFARVFVKTVRDDGQAESEVASHELAEMIADPNVNLTAPDFARRRLYALELGDPVQGTGYDVGEPEGRTTGIKVANFALPAYFDPNTTSERVDYRGVLKAPFTIAPQGYMSWLDLTNIAAGWQQSLGAERTTPPPPDHDDRLQQRLRAGRPGG